MSAEGSSEGAKRDDITSAAAALCLEENRSAHALLEMTTQREMKV